MGTIDDIYDALLDEAAFEALPSRLAATVGARSATLQVYEGAVPIHVSAHYFSAEMSQYFLDHDLSRHDIWTTTTIRQGRMGQAINSDGLMSRGDFADSLFYNDFIRRFGDDTGVCVGAVVETRQGMISLGLQNALTAPGFDSAAVTRIDAFLPHLTRMVDARALLRSAQDRRGDAEAVLDRLAVGAILVEASGRIVMANAAARAALDGRDGLVSCAGLLTALEPRTESRLAAALAQATGREGRFGGAVAVGRPSGRRAYRLVLTPHRPAGSHRTLTLVLIDDPETATPGLASILSDLFALTPAEADLAVRLLNGASVEEASEARGVRVSTGRTQLKHLLEKTETRRQGEMLSLLARLPGVTTPPT